MGPDKANEHDDNNQGFIKTKGDSNTAQKVIF